MAYVERAGGREAVGRLLGRCGVPREREGWLRDPNTWISYALTRALYEAAAEPRSDNLHEWRKRVKDLWHALQILRSAAPKRMSKLAKRTPRLSDLLDDDHDLAELRGYILEHRGLFDDRLAIAALMRAIDHRRTEL